MKKTDMDKYDLRIKKDTARVIKESGLDLKKTTNLKNKCPWCDANMNGIHPFITLIKRDANYEISIREFCTADCWINWMWELITLNLETEGEFDYDYL